MVLSLYYFFTDFFVDFLTVFAFLAIAFLVVDFLVVTFFTVFFLSVIFTETKFITVIYVFKYSVSFLDWILNITFKKLGKIAQRVTVKKWEKENPISPEFLPVLYLYVNLNWCGCLYILW